MSSSPSLAISEVHISGTTLSYLIRAAYSASDGIKYTFDLVGHHTRRYIITDSSDRSAIVETVITGAAPQTLEGTCAGVEKIGYLSIAKSPLHKLSWHDTQLMMKKPPGSSTYPHLFMLVTAESAAKPSCGTLKVEYTVFQIVQGTPRAIPLLVDNVVESLVGFTKIEDNYRRNPSVLTMSPAHRAAIGAKTPAFSLDESLDQVKRKCTERENLIQRISNLQQKLADLEASKSCA